MCLQTKWCIKFTVHSTPTKTHTFELSLHSSVRNQLNVSTSFKRIYTQIHSWINSVWWHQNWNQSHEIKRHTYEYCPRGRLTSVPFGPYQNKNIKLIEWRAVHMLSTLPIELRCICVWENALHLSRINKSQVLKHFYHLHRYRQVHYNAFQLNWHGVNWWLYFNGMMHHISSRTHFYLETIF